jgi:hypothetical protein
MLERQSQSYREDDKGNGITVVYRSARPHLLALLHTYIAFDLCDKLYRKLRYDPVVTIEGE